MESVKRMDTKITLKIAFPDWLVEKLADMAIEKGVPLEEVIAESFEAKLEITFDDS